MLKNYFVLAYRNLLKNKLSSSINIIGLSVAVGCSILVFLVVDLQATKDRFHENGEDIFLVGHTIVGPQGEEAWGSSPVALGPALASEIPAIERAVRISNGSGAVRYGDKVFEESIRFVDPEFLDMFTFRLKEGRPEALRDNRSLILSEDLAEKYFGAEDPLGETLTITFEQTQTEVFTVGGVAAEFPLNASFTFDILLAFDVQQDLGVSLVDNWSRNTRATFIEVSDPSIVEKLPEQLKPYLTRQRDARADRPFANFFFEPLFTLSSHAYRIKGVIAGGEVPEAIIFLTLIGVFLLVLACINYTNVAVASAARRVKEIGIRKVVGGQRWQLIGQFLIENALLCLLALIVGIGLAEFFFIPGFTSITGNNGSLSLADFFQSSHLWLFFVGLLLVTSIGAGAYPALYISGVAPISILRGHLKVKGKEGFTRVLLTVQFMISFLAIALVVVMWQNNEYQRNLDWGYQQEHIIGTSLEDSTQFALLRDRLAQEADVLQVAGAANHIGHVSLSSVVEFNETTYPVMRFDVGPTYIETMGLRIKDGRTFDPNIATEADEALLVNEKMVQTMGWTEPVGLTFRFDNQMYTVIGVVEDFHHRHFFDEIPPTMIRLAPESAFNYLIVRTREGKGFAVTQTLRQTWRSLFPNSPYGGFFQDSVFERAFRDNQTIMGLMGTTGVIALLLSCMGLFGLVVLIIAKKRRDLSIHKVLGATVWQVTQLINRPFTRLLLIAALVATPLTYFLLDLVLGSIYEYHVSVGAVPFLVGAGVIVGTAVLTIASQVYRAATDNPVDALRTE